MNMIEIMQREMIEKLKIIETEKNVKIKSLTEDRIEKLLIMINEMKANSIHPQPELFLQSKDRKEKFMVTVIVVLSIFVICLVGSSWYCCQKYVKSNQGAVTVNTINETEKIIKVMRSPIK